MAVVDLAVFGSTTKMASIASIASTSSVTKLCSTSSVKKLSPLQQLRPSQWRSNPRVAPPVAMAISSTSASEEDVSSVSRRQACFEVATALASSLLVKPGDASAREVEVGSYLPVASVDPNFVQFKASTKDTPALRAGNVLPYEFVLPPSWKQERVANILSGNYCQPKCAEPWVEVKFSEVKQGALQVVAAPMVRLTNKPNATIEEIGDPERILAALGPFVTGNSFDPEEVVETTVERRGDQTFYKYQLETPFAKTGPHNLATATAKGSVVMLFVVSASDKQWQASEPLLRTILESFGV